jgi:hypothetical protein
VTMNVADLEKLVRNVGAVDADAAAVPTPDLLRRLFLALRSLDPAVRDDFALYTLTRWIVIERRVAPAGLGQLHGWASSDEGILRDLGGTDSASVFGRSFALVLLSALHAVDNEAPFLDHDGWQRTRDALAAYGAAELDVRSFVEGCGWVHTIAHLSDVCDELARSSRCDVSSARILLTALVVSSDGGPTFSPGRRTTGCPCVCTRSSPPRAWVGTRWWRQSGVLPRRTRSRASTGDRPRGPWLCGSPNPPTRSAPSQQN